MKWLKTTLDTDSIMAKASLIVLVQLAILAVHMLH